MRQNMGTKSRELLWVVVEVSMGRSSPSPISHTKDKDLLWVLVIDTTTHSRGAITKSSCFSCHFLLPFGGPSCF